jgi:hypothetical protein
MSTGQMLTVSGSIAHNRRIDTSMGTRAMSPVFSDRSRVLRYARTDVALPYRPTRGL